MRGEGEGETGARGNVVDVVHDSGCSRAVWVEGCFKRHWFRTWARGEQQ